MRRAMLPAERPRYLMGVGKPVDLVEAVARGVDMFDCVLPDPLRPPRPGLDAGRPVNLKNAASPMTRRRSIRTIDCPASRDYSKAYLHHLVKSDELLGQVLLSWHNLAFFED